MNQFFRFKGFTIRQENCAMKVCTDSCLFGAWVADKLRTNAFLAKNILDAGAGTGLLSMMISQATPALIDAVEIDSDAFETMRKNVAGAGKSLQINCVRSAIQQYTPEKKYDLIVCNPPFYEDHLTSPHKTKNTAMHAADLSFDDLTTYVGKHLSTAGTACFLLPQSVQNRFIDKLLRNNLCINDLVGVSHSDQHPVTRILISARFTASAMKKDHINIRGVENFYSERFCMLLQDYYLDVRR